MGSWQMNGRISRDLLDPTLAWSALPDAPVRHDRRRVSRWSTVWAAVRSYAPGAPSHRAPAPDAVCAPARATDAVCTPS